MHNYLTNYHTTTCFDTIVSSWGSFPADHRVAAGQLAISQYPEGPVTGHLDTGFSWFPWVQERRLRWFPPFQVASTCFSCSPPDLNSVVTNCLLSYYVKWPLPPGDNSTAVNKYYYYYFYVSCHRPILPGNSLEPTVIPTAQASSFTLQYFPYYVWCSKYSCLL